MKTFSLISVLLFFTGTVHASTFPTGAFKCEKVLDSGAKILISTGTIDEVAFGTESLPLLTMTYENTTYVDLPGMKIKGIATLQEHRGVTLIIVPSRGDGKGVKVSPGGKIFADFAYSGTTCSQ